MPLSLEQFEAQLTSSGLISTEEVGAVRGALAAADAESLARELVRQKRLTAFQAQQCFAGKGKSLVLGNYVLLDRLGQGGMGMVLKAEHKRMKRIVALKVLSPAVAKNQELVARFQREVEAAARLTHPNIVAAYDADEANGTVFLVMEYVAGSDLSSLIKKSGPLALPQAVQCVLQAARGLDYAHRQGVIHRDIKPANLLLDQSGVVKILDMGLARIEGDTSGKAELTSTGAVMGTVDYMAPEQALSTKHADARSDIYSLGVSLWYLLVGKPLFEGDSLMARLIAHREFAPPSLCEARPDVPPELNSLFQRMVAKKATERPQTMAEIITVLESIQRGESITAITPGQLPSDDSKFSAFLSNLNDSTQARTGGPTSLAAAKGLAVDSRSDATITSSDGDVSTDPHTLSIPSSRGAVRQKKTRRNKPKSQTGGSQWWQDRRLHWGGTAAAALLLVLAFTFFRSTPESTAGPSATANNANLAAAIPALADGPQTVQNVRPPASEPWTLLTDSRDPQAGWATLGPFRWVDGVITASGPGMAVSRETYSDFELEFEWRVGPQGNTGVYYRTDASAVDGSAYPGTEFQLMDDGHFSGGKVTSKATGSLFGLFTPTRLANRPAGEWNAGRIVARGNSVEHWINGERVVSYEIGSPQWQQALAAASPPALRQNVGNLSGNILLQSHGGEVAYRNIRIRRLQTAESPSDAPSEFALEFNSEDDIVTLPSLPVGGLNQLTLEAVVEPAASNPYLCYIASLAEVRLGIQFNILQFGGAFKYGAPSAGVFATGVDLQPHQTCCVAGVWDGDVTRLFVDGRLIAVNEDGESLLFGSDPEFTIGSAKVYVRGELLNRYFRGRIRELRFSRTARYTEDYDPRLPLTADADTIALYRFNEGQGDVLHDSSGHGYHGLITGASWVRAEPWRGPTVPKSQFVDLLSQLDLTRDRPDTARLFDLNHWSLQNGTLAYIPDGKSGRVTFPVDMSTARDFELSLDIKRLADATPVWLQFAMAANAWCSLDVTVNGKVELRLPNGERVPIGNWPASSNGAGSLSMRVTRDANGPAATVAVKVDRTQVGRWAGDIPAASETNAPPPPGNTYLALFCYRDPHEFANVFLRVYDGTARLLRSPPTLSASPAQQPNVAVLATLNTGDYNASPWLSEDGLRLYWERVRSTGTGSTAETVMASRPSLFAPFGEPRSVAAGRMATLSPDELELICVPGANGGLHVTRRAKLEDPFPPPAPLSLPERLQGPKSPCLLSDGLRLVVQDNRPEGTVILQASRSGRTDAWTMAEPLNELGQAARGIPITWPFLSANRLQVWYGHGGDRETQIWTATRSALEQPFANFEPVLIAGQPLVGRAPRYCAISRELFFSRPAGTNGWELAVVRNYVPAPGSAIYATPPRPSVQVAPAPSPALVPADGHTDRFALEFDGEDDYVDITGDWKYDGGPLTFEAWVVPGASRSTMGAHHLFVADYGAGNDWHAVRFARRVDPDDNGAWRRINASDPTRSIITSVDDLLSEGELVHLAAVWDGDEQRIFVNGQRGSEKLWPWQYRPRPVPAYAWLGAFQTASADGLIVATDCWSGQMRQVRITAGALYTESFQPPTDLTSRPDTIVLYQFSDGDGDLLRDSSGHNRHGKIVGPKWVRVERAELPGVSDREIAEWAIGLGGRVWWPGLPAEAKQLSDLPSTPFQIHTLHLQGCKITDDDLRRISRLKGLGHLSLHNTGVTDAGLKHLEGHPTLSILQPYNCPITDASIPVLATLRLQSVNLGNTSITGGGIATLARAGASADFWHLSGLKSLNDDTLRMLATLPRITEIDVRETAVTSAGIAALLQAHPRAKVQADVTIPGPMPTAAQQASVDILAGVSLARDGLVYNTDESRWEIGGWTRVTNGWESGATGRHMLRLRPTQAPSTYRLSLEGIPTSNRTGAWVPFVIGDTACFFAVNGFIKGETAKAGFGYVDDKPENLNPTTRDHPALKAGQPVRIDVDVDVRGDQVTLVGSINGEEVSRFAGPISRLSVPAEILNFYDRQRAQFGVGATGPFVVTRVRLQERPASTTGP